VIPYVNPDGCPRNVKKKTKKKPKQTQNTTHYMTDAKVRVNNAYKDFRFSPGTFLERM
jgi:hypothetical protein